jgi:molybdopterin-containing oxidoreductase family iron-sulfur binding subunit
MEKHPAEPQMNSTVFKKPRYWIGPDELEASYWDSPEVREKRGQEFYEKPVEQISMIDRADSKGMARRDFLTIMGASMAMASLSCARRPVHKIIPYVTKPEEVTPGVPNWYASTSRDCGHGCGILVKNREGRPIKLEGNPDHPVNRGALCARGQASLLSLYDPERLQKPLSRTGPGSDAREISWADADAAIQAKLKGGSAKVRVLSKPIRSDSTRKLLSDFLGSFSNAELVEFEPLAYEEIADAQKASYGTALIPRYRFDKADVILSLGADFLGNWVSPVENAADWARNRKIDSSKKEMSKLFCFEPTMTVTGANADERYPVRPGDELKVALAVAHELILVQKKSRFAGDGAISSLLSGYTPAAVGQEIGIEPKKFSEIAEALAAAPGKSLVVGGSLASRSETALALQLAINLLNSALDNDGETVDGTAAYQAAPGSTASFLKLLTDLQSGSVDILILYRSNPAYWFAGGNVPVIEALQKAPLVISVSDREDESARLSHFVLPDHHYLENWGDYTPRKGTLSLQQPALSPLFSTRSFEDSLLTWIKGASLKGSPLAAASADWHAYLQGRWKETVYRDASPGTTFDLFWESALRSGVFSPASSASSSRREFKAASLSVVPKYTADTDPSMRLALYAKVSMYDGAEANNAWLQEMPDPLSSVTWDNYLNVSPQAAKKRGWKENDVIAVKTGSFSGELPVHIQPGLSDSVVSVAVGYGRTSVGKVGNLAGVNVYPAVVLKGTTLAFSGHKLSDADAQATGKFYQLASTQWHTAKPMQAENPKGTLNETDDRPIVNDITFAAWKKNPGTTKHTDPGLREETPSIWPGHEYKSYRWGMTIDLNSCTGCGACVIGCQAENNIPVVGREQVRNSRQMHWIRIDRYYSGSPEQPDVIFQPMLCQHCENAPCETVCPVLATVHDDEGVNVQVYNRCVGTRYCQNNCPYKVRRFNFFDHWKSYEGTMNMVWNPDVTVRSRGIMEKCTFCTQRVMEAKDKAKDNHERVRDGDVKTACQQTCPTDAISFGDINDPTSRVSRLKADPRDFGVLTGLNTKPSVTYMTKVRNKEHLAYEEDRNDDA